MTRLELDKYNKKVLAKRGAKAVSGGALVVLGMVLLLQVGYSNGVTHCQEWMSKTFPEEYGSMTDKILENN